MTVRDRTARATAARGARCFSHLANAAGYRLDWSTVDDQRNIAASIAATRRR